MMCLFGDDSEQDHINDENDDCNDDIGDGVCVMIMTMAEGKRFILVF